MSHDSECLCIDCCNARRVRIGHPPIIPMSDEEREELRVRVLRFLTKVRDIEGIPPDLRSRAAQLLMKAGDDSAHNLEIAYGDTEGA